MFGRLARLLRVTGRELFVLLVACRYPATPLHVKLLTLLVAVYIISPFDVIPDFLAVAGWIDDVTLLTLVVPALVKRIPSGALHAARSTVSQWPLFKRFRETS